MGSHDDLPLEGGNGSVRLLGPRLAIARRVARASAAVQVWLSGEMATSVRRLRFGEQRQLGPDGPVEFLFREAASHYSRLEDTRYLTRSEIVAYDKGLERGVRLALSQIVCSKTGLYLRFLHETLGSHIEWVQQDSRRCAYYVLGDGRNFAAVNDELGHARGDEVLGLFAQTTLRELRRRHDVTGFRPGGDEDGFVLRGRSDVFAREAIVEAGRAVDAEVAMRPDLTKLRPSAKRRNVLGGVGMDYALVRIREDHTVRGILEEADVQLYALKEQRRRPREEHPGTGLQEAPTALIASGRT